MELIRIIAVTVEAIEVAYCKIELIAIVCFNSIAYHFPNGRYYIILSYLYVEI